MQHPNPAGLQDALADGIRKFEAQARAQGLPNEQVIAGRYILCTLLDESAASTPWGGSGVWANQSLLVQFHNETWGGEKVFQLMTKLAENVGANRNLLELLYVVLAFGFEGRYRVLNNGKAQLDSVRERLAQMLGQQRGGGADRALSPRWEGVPAREQRLGRRHAAVGRDRRSRRWCCAVVYVALRLSLNGHSDDGLRHAARPRREGRSRSRAPPPPAPAPRLAQLLKPEIEAGPDHGAGPRRPLDRDHQGRRLLRARQRRRRRPRQAAAAAHRAGADRRCPGTIADHRPHRQPADPHRCAFRRTGICRRTAPTRSRRLLGKTVKPERLRAEGRADAEPVGDNATAAGRAQQPPRRDHPVRAVSGASRDRA